MSLPLWSILICPVSSGFCAVCLLWCGRPGAWLLLLKATERTHERKHLKVGTAGTREGDSYQVAVVGHDVVLHPCGRLQLFPTVLTGERLLHTGTRVNIRWGTGLYFMFNLYSPVGSSPCASSAPPPSSCSHSYIWDR